MTKDERDGQVDCPPVPGLERAVCEAQLQIASMHRFNAILREIRRARLSGASTYDLTVREGGCPQ